MEKGRVATLFLNDPERRNPLSPKMVEGLLAALEELEADQGVRALVLTGRGQAFSAGADLAFLERVTEMGAEENYRHSLSLMALFRRLYTFPKPTVAA